jgi:hypothetical protein
MSAMCRDYLFCLFLEVNIFDKMLTNFVYFDSEGYRKILWEVGEEICLSPFLYISQNYLDDKFEFKGTDKECEMFIDLYDLISCQEIRLLIIKTLFEISSGWQFYDSDYGWTKFRTHRGKKEVIVERFTYDTRKLRSVCVRIDGEEVLYFWRIDW